MSEAEPARKIVRLSDGAVFKVEAITEIYPDAETTITAGKPSLKNVHLVYDASINKEHPFKKFINQKEKKKRCKRDW